MTALKTRDHVGAFGKPIYNLAFAFVTPLGAHHNNISHNVSSFDRIKT
jgi:hypothetical protein